MPRPLVATVLTTTDGGTDAVSLVVGGTPGTLTGVGGVSSGPITLADAVPATTTNKLYNSGGRLQFNGTPVGTQILLSAGNFSSSSAGATNLATYTFGATTLNTLTVLDSIRIDLAYYGTGGASTVWLRQNSTDFWGTSATGLNNGTVNWSSTSVVVKLADVSGLTRVGVTGNNDAALVTGAATLSANYTGSFTIELRYSGSAGVVQAGWAIYRVLGQ